MTQTGERILVALGIVMAFLLASTIWNAATSHDQDGIPCEAIGAAYEPNGALLIIRECPDGRIIRDYPHPEGE